MMTIETGNVKTTKIQIRKKNLSAQLDCTLVPSAPVIYNRSELHELTNYDTLEQTFHCYFRTSLYFRTCFLVMPKWSK